MNSEGQRYLGTATARFEGSKGFIIQSDEYGSELRAML